MPKKNVPIAQPASALFYAVLALIGGGVGVGLLFFYVAKVPRLIEQGVQAQIFYILLIPWALSAAAFLFGAMRSFATFTHKSLSNALELGGPVVLFLIVILVGIHLVQTTDTFDLTVRAHAADGSNPVIRQGKVSVQFGSLTRAENFGSDGDANFKGISRRFWGNEVRILPQVVGYKDEWLSAKIGSDSVDLSLDKLPPPSAMLAGRIVPGRPKGKDVRIVAEGGGEGTVDDLGRFRFPVAVGAGESIRVMVLIDGRVKYDGFQPVSEKLVISLRL